MARKTHTKQMRTREMFLTAKMFGGPKYTDTSNGKILLNVMKHYCLQKPYENEEYNSIMLYEISKIAKQRKEAAEGSNA